MITITRHEYIWGEHEDRHAAHVAYYSQFVTPSVKQRLENFLSFGGNIDVLREVDRLAASAPADVARLLEEAGDYPTLAGLVCIYKVAYELRGKGNDR